MFKTCQFVKCLHLIKIWYPDGHVAAIFYAMDLIFSGFKGDLNI
jgi:hypothetical protein